MRTMVRVFILAMLTGLAGSYPAFAQETGTEGQDSTAESDEQKILGKYDHPMNRLPGITQECIFFRNLHDWTALDDYTLLVYAPSRNHPYLVLLERRCTSLRFQDTIAFATNADGRLCAFGGDSIIVGDSGFVDRCPIGAIHRLTAEEEKRVKAEFKAGKFRRDGEDD